jgi:hypothetical protein
LKVLKMPLLLVLKKNLMPLLLLVLPDKPKTKSMNQREPLLLPSLP